MIPEFIHDPAADFHKAFPEITVLRMKSVPNGIETLTAKGISIDYLHIDGDRTYEGAKNDFRSFAPLLAPGGLVSLHEQRWEGAYGFGVWTLIDEIRLDTC